MLWIVLFAVVVLLACFAVIAVMLWRTYQRVKSLGRTVAAASARIAEASAALEEIAPAADLHSGRRLSPKDGS